MKTHSLILAAFAAALLLPGCAPSGNASEREWERAQCGQVIDKEAREKCMKRVDGEYGKR